MSENKKLIEYGGFAFPTPELRAPNGMVLSAGSDGMSLRDWFAGQALVGMMASDGNDGTYWKPANAAANAYEIADAMLAARKGGA